MFKVKKIRRNLLKTNAKKNYKNSQRRQTRLIVFQEFLKMKSEKVI